MTAALQMKHNNEYSFESDDVQNVLNELSKSECNCARRRKSTFVRKGLLKKLLNFDKICYNKLSI